MAQFFLFSLSEFCCKADYALFRVADRQFPAQGFTDGPGNGKTNPITGSLFIVSSCAVSAVKTFEQIFLGNIHFRIAAVFFHDGNGFGFL